MKRWYKKDIKSMRGAIDSWLLVNRPAPHKGIAGQSLGFRDAARAHLSDLEKRKAVVLGDIRMLRNRAKERGQENTEAARHFEANPAIYGNSTPMMVERFDQLAAENAKGVTKLNKLLARIEEEGMPPEVVAYDPFRAV